MLDAVQPALFALFVWWFSTGALMYAVGRAPSTFRWTMLVMSGLLVVAIYGIAQGAHDTSTAGAYWAFTYSLLAWAWAEASFLTGRLTGPRTTDAPLTTSGRQRFVAATETVIHHELAIAAIGILIAGLTWDQPNQTALWTYVILWALRLSAKFNLFLGVQNSGRNLLPRHLAYIGTYLPNRPMNGLFPFSITAGTALTVALIAYAGHPGTTAYLSTSATLLAALTGLGVLEHWAMVLPLPIDKLVTWSRSGSTHSGTTQPVKAVTASANVHAEPTDAQSWSQSLSPECDPSGLKTVLVAVADGHYGQVDQLQGVAKAGSGWIQFHVIAGKLRMGAFAPSHVEQPRVTAIGQRVDTQKLKAAFEACAAAAA
jgi:putative photosynthetic complex assembly protein 2